MAQDDYYICDPWPKMPDGQEFDGSDLLNLVRKGSSPFKDAWDVSHLLHEVEADTGAKVVDIAHVSKGSNNMGLHMKLSDQREILVRLGRSDVNMPKYDGFPLDSIIRELHFEAATYDLLAGHPEVPTTTLIHWRDPIKREAADHDVEKSVQGRRLMVFAIPQGKSDIWSELQPEGRDDLVAQAAVIRASLFKYNPPKGFVATFLLRRIFAFMPDELPCSVEPTRDFWLAVFRSKIEATIRNKGDMIGWESDNNTVGPEALKAKQSLLRFLPHMLPEEEDLYRMVLEHGDFGIHNMSIVAEPDLKHVHVTSLYDWETGCIWPALLADPEMALAVDLVADGDGKASLKRVWEGASADDVSNLVNHAKNYFEVLYQHAPDFERVIKAGKDARHFWFQLKNWRGDDPEEFFGELGAWAERRMAEMGV